MAHNHSAADRAVAPRRVVEAFLRDEATAKLVRESDEKVRAMTARAADVYVKRWKRYAAGLTRIG